MVVLDLVFSANKAIGTKTKGPDAAQMDRRNGVAARG
jgi:hypothetical protein